jgi:hypothetical protein
MSVEDLKRIVVRGHATIRVGCLGISRIASDSIAVNFDTHWAAYIMAIDAQGADRDETAMHLVGAVGALVVGNLWSREDLDDPKDIRAENLYSGTLDKRAVALWAVTWSQQWTPQDAAASGLDLFLRAHVEWDINQDGSTDTVDDINLRQ